MSKQFLLVLVAIVAVFLGILTFSKREAQQSNGNGGDDGPTTSQHIYGNPDAKVILVEFGDFQCPACLGFFPVVKEIKERYQDEENFAFQFRHFPLSEIHQNAVISSRAAEAAAKQGKFWEMHDKLYENQNTWGASPSPSQYFETYAEELGLDVEKFKEDIKSSEVNSIVQADRNEARKQGYGSTPTFVLNGKQLENPPRTAEEFAKLIDEALKNAE